MAEQELEMMSRIKKLRSSNAGNLTKRCNKAMRAIDEQRSKATLRDCAESIQSDLGVLKGTHELYLSVLTLPREIQKAEEWMNARFEYADQIIHDIEIRLLSGDLQSYTTGRTLSESVSSHHNFGQLYETTQGQVHRDIRIVQKQASIQREMNASRIREEVQMGKAKQLEIQEWLKEHKPPPDVRQKTTLQPTEVTAAAMIAERQPNLVPRVKYLQAATRDLEPAHVIFKDKPDIVKKEISYKAPAFGNQTAPVTSYFTPSAEHYVTPGNEYRFMSDGVNRADAKETELNPVSPAWEPRPPIDEWIDKLVSGQETVLPKQKTTQSEDPMLAALVKLESDRGLPATQIPTFDGAALLWPKFVEQFYTQVHCKPGIDDARRMDLLQSHVSKDALTMIRGIGYSGRCYADALKELKRAFGHRNQVARAYLDLITTGNSIPSRNPVALRQFFVDVRDCIITLTQLNYTSDMQGTDLLLRVSRRLPVDRIRFWNRHVSGISKTREPSILDLRNWLKECVDTEFNPYSVKLETSKGKTPATACSYNTAFRKTNQKSEKSERGARGAAKPEKSYSAARDVEKPRKAVPTEGGKKPISCPLCKEPHRLYRCFLFVNKRPQERSKIAEDSKICLNCLHSNHELSQCLSNLRCREPGCQGKHHTLLHPDDKDPKRNYANIAEKSSRKKPSRAYFQLVRVNVSGKNGRCIPTVAMLDSASEITVIHQQLAQDLGLKGKTKELTIKTLNAESSSKSQTVSFSMRAAGEESPRVIHVSEAWTVDIDAFQCPPQQMSTSWDHIQGLGLTDIDACEVQLLIGVDVPLAHVQTDTRMGDETAPIAVKTPLGWMLIGMSEARDSPKAIANVNFITSRDQQLHQDIEKFWQTESFGVAFTTENPLSAEDKRAIKILEETTHLVDGHYEVGMLWKNPDAALPNNKHIAVRRYHLLEKRMKKDSEYKSLYSDTLNGYIEKGFARKLSVIEAEKISPKTWYIPHHGVMNPNKPGKIRVVFDAAATCQGTSLNLNLMTGPDLLNSLFGVLQRFRLYRIAMCADVEGMFHMVRVPETTDADALRFMWKSNIDAPGPPESYKMLVHIFGATDSPTCANYALQKSARDSVGQYSQQAIDTVLRSFYVDDVAKSVDSVPIAVQLAKEVVNILKGGGFRLHKWFSNSMEFLQHIEESERSIQDLDFVAKESSNIQRTLGLKWDIKKDIFIFKCQPKDNPLTKRGVVSTVSSIFDPHGYLAPFIIRAKIFVQELWRSGLSWDEPLTEVLSTKWSSWLQDLQHVSSFKLPRHHLNFSPRVEDIQIHVFSDASEAGFGAVAYLRYSVENGPPTSSLLAAKTRVAPIKPVLSIPRLELQGALLAARLVKSLKKELDIAITTSTYWTDSTTVLRYLKNETKRFKSFVANRISEILETTQPEQWRYVPTNLNPADCCSRGVGAATLCNDQQWQEGPVFLQHKAEDWLNLENKDCLVGVTADDPEVKKIETKSVNTVTTKGDDNKATPTKLDFTCILDPLHFSSWNRLIRKTAWLSRAIHNFASVIPRLATRVIRSPSIKAAEYQEAVEFWIRVAQQDRFQDEIASLRSHEALSPRSKLAQLMPFFDETNNCLRVGGRLRKADIPTEAKYQLILPADHAVTLLLFNDTHRTNSHCGREHLLAIMRQRYWPVNGRVLARKTIRSCLLCWRRYIRPVVPRMADLPKCRLSVTSGPFFHTGLDYFGPMMVKVRRSSIKRWGCLFTCLGTRAVHIELAESLETDDFILCLRRFIGRRGHPKTIHSDNGTNFHGANNELKDCLLKLRQSKVQEFLSPLGVEWIFNPPASPHMGGSWESLVKSVKAALKAVLPKHRLAESVLRTALVEVEAVVNSRPLTHNSSEPDDLTALTPNHFLIGRAVNVAAPDVVVDREIDSRKRWRQAQVIADHVCRRWVAEYLPTLTVRRKWLKEERSLAPNDLVIVQNDHLPRGSWEMARVLDVYPGDDGRVRSVLLKSAKSTYVRPASRICLLEENVNVEH